MTFAAAMPKMPAGPFLGTALMLAAVLISVAALTTRGPDLSVAPDMVAVLLPQPLWVQRHEVTVAEWNRCADAAACDRTLTVSARQDPATTPATGINHPEATQFAVWISATTGHAYRLPSAAEWSVFARDVVVATDDPIFAQPELDWASAYLLGERKTRALRPSGTFSVSPAGVADLDGSVWEWTSDCYAGSAGPTSENRCPAYVVGGEHFAVMSWLERDPARGGCAVGTPPAHLGLRLVSETEPPTRIP